MEVRDRSVPWSCVRIDFLESSRRRHQYVIITVTVVVVIETVTVVIAIVTVTGIGSSSCVSVHVTLCLTFLEQQWPPSVNMNHASNLARL